MTSDYLQINRNELPHIQLADFDRLAIAGSRKFRLESGSTTSDAVEFDKSHISLDGLRYNIHSNDVAGYTFIQKIPGRLEYISEDDVWLITEDIFDEYGVGASRQQAKRDYLSGLISYYESLEELATEENIGVRRQFEELRKYFLKDA
jgi:hypothetical protein